MKYSDIERIREQEEEFFSTITTEPFELNINVVEKTISTEEFFDATGAVFRGVLVKEVNAALEYLGDKNIEKSSVAPGVWEFKVEYFWKIENFLYLVKNFPGLKVAAFLENEDGFVYMCYSKSGYPYISELYGVDPADYHSEIRWSYMHFATEMHFSGEDEFGYYSYEFLYKEDWEKMNYVFKKDGILQLIV